MVSSSQDLLELEFTFPTDQTPTEEVRVHDVHFDNITFMGNKCETWQDMRLVTELANDIYVNGVRTCRQMKF